MAGTTGVSGLFVLEAYKNTAKIAEASSTIASGLIILSTISLLLLPGTGPWVLITHDPTERQPERHDTTKTRT